MTTFYRTNLYLSRSGFILCWFPKILLEYILISKLAFIRKFLVEGEACVIGGWQRSKRMCNVNL